MAVTLEVQYMTLLVMSINGAVLGAVYDMYRVVLQHWKFLRWAGPIFDFAFWILAVFLVFSSLMWANHGDLRIYVFVVLLIGLIGYRILFRRIVVGSTIGIIMGIRYIFLVFSKTFLIVIINPLKYLFRGLLGVIRILDRLLQILEKMLLWPITSLSKILLWAVRILLNLMGKLARPFVKPIEPFLKPLIQKGKPILRRIKRVFSTEKGFWVRLTKWLFR